MKYTVVILAALIAFTSADAQAQCRKKSSCGSKRTTARTSRPSHSRPTSPSRIPRTAKRPKIRAKKAEKPAPTRTLTLENAAGTKIKLVSRGESYKMYLTCKDLQGKTQVKIHRIRRDQFDSLHRLALGMVKYPAPKSFQAEDIYGQDCSLEIKGDGYRWKNYIGFGTEPAARTRAKIQPTPTQKKSFATLTKKMMDLAAPIIRNPRIQSL